MLTHDKSSHGLWPGEAKNVIWPWGQRSRSHEGHYGTWHTVLWSCIHIPNIIDLSRKTKNVMAQTRKYHLKNNYLTFRSKVKVQRRSLWYATHRLMDMHAHTKYHWPISKETIIWPWGQRSRFKQRSLWYTTHLLWSCTHIPNIIDLSKDKKCYDPNKKILFKKQLFDLEVKGHYGMQHTTLWICTHIPNIIDLSGKKKVMVRTSFAEKQKKRKKKKSA